jgi:DUF2917 family protein
LWEVKQTKQNNLLLKSHDDPVSLSSDMMNGRTTAVAGRGSVTGHTAAVPGDGEDERSKVQTGLSSGREFPPARKPDKETNVGARELEIDQGAMLKLEALEGDSLYVRFGEVWVTQHEDSRDYLLKTGDSLTLSGRGATLATAHKPTLLDLYRNDPLAVREQIVREARRAQARAMKAWFRRIFA